MIEKPKTKLRTGFTTGTCATAASKAAILSIINQKKIELVKVILPKGNTIDIKIKSCSFNKNIAKCSVIKDAGDDPDVTHGAEIIVELILTKNVNRIEIEGGDGVGTVTKPGLGLEVGKSAINPIPKKMIIENIKEVASEILKKNGIRIIISVPKGKELALKTDNPRLGILGGISILGTSGIVVPYSTASFAAAIRQNLDVSLAMGNYEVILTTGGRSEEFAKKIFDFPDHCFVQIGDFAGYAIQQCAKKGVKMVHIAGFIGKLAKIAAGVTQTHVKGSKVDTYFLAELARQCNAKQALIEQIKKANTARHVLEMVKENNVISFFERLCIEAYKHTRKHSEEKVPIEIILFDFDGKVIVRFDGS